MYGLESYMMTQNTKIILFELLKTSLFTNSDMTDGTNKSLLEVDDWAKVYQIAQEQSVQGLVLFGIEKYRDYHDEMINIPQSILLQWIGEVQLIEQKNRAMNEFIARLIEKLRNENIYAILVKGQGVAQSYEKPLWRSSGDVDLLLSNDNYEKAKTIILSMGVLTEPEEANKKHFAVQIGQWSVELHGTLHVGLSARVDRMLDNVQYDIFHRGKVRSWVNGQTHVFLPAATEDVVYVFAHILQHFYKGGIGLRQVCDWCRLLWTYRESLSYEYLESKIREAGLMSEWKAFGVFAVRYLGMPIEAIPMLHANENLEAYVKKADKIREFILEVGNFGHNRDNSYFHNHSYIVQNGISAWRRVKDLCRHATIFPVNSVRFFFGIMHNGIVSTLRGE